MIVLVIIDTDNEGTDTVTLTRGGDKDLLSTSLDMLPCSSGVNKDTGSLNHNINAELLPGQLERVSVGDDLDFLTIDSDRFLSGDDIGVKGTKNGIVFEKMGGGLDAGSIINTDDVHVGIGTTCPATNEVTSDTAETIDRYAHLHGRGGGGTGRCGGSVDGVEEDVIRIGHAPEEGAFFSGLETCRWVDTSHSRELGKAGSSLRRSKKSGGWHDMRVLVTTKERGARARGGAEVRIVAYIADGGGLSGCEDRGDGGDEGHD